MDLKRVRFALLLMLSVMAGMTHQQTYYRYRPANDYSRSLWLSEQPPPPFLARRFAFLNSNRYPFAYNKFYDEHDNFGPLFLSPSPVFPDASEQQEGDDMVDPQIHDDEWPDSQARMKFPGNIINRISNKKRPEAHEEQAGRFLFPNQGSQGFQPFRQTVLKPYISGSFDFPYSSTDNLLRTILFTVTVNATTAVIVSCIPPAAFAVGPPAGQNVPCGPGRRRRDVESLEQYDNIAPTSVELFTPTAAIGNQERLLERVKSSKEENDDLLDEPNDVEPTAHDDKRAKRFFLNNRFINQPVVSYYPVTTMTVTTYQFSQTTCTSTENFGANLLVCLPPGSTVCGNI